MIAQRATTEDNTSPEFKGHDPRQPDSSSRSSREDTANNDGYGSSDEHVFSDPAVAEHWRHVFEKARYENRHRFDPNYR